MSLNFETSQGFWTAKTIVPGIAASIEIRIYVDNSPSPTDRQFEVAGKVVAYLQSAWPNIVKSAEAYCRNVDDAVDLQDEGIRIDYSHLDRHFTPRNILISHLDGVQSDFYFVGCDCDWEEEHGMQFVMEAASVLGCGGHTGAFIMTKDDATYRSIAESYDG